MKETKLSLLNKVISYRDIADAKCIEERKNIFGA